jgi:hypothetical protein
VLAPQAEIRQACRCLDPARSDAHAFVEETPVVQTIILEPDQEPPIDLDHVLVNQDPKSGGVIVSGNVRDPKDPKGVIVLTAQAFWSGNAEADEERGMRAAEEWASKYGIAEVYVRRRAKVPDGRAEKQGQPPSSSA